MMSVCLLTQVNNGEIFERLNVIGRFVMEKLRPGKVIYASFVRPDTQEEAPFVEPNNLEDENELSKSGGGNDDTGDMRGSSGEG